MTAVPDRIISTVCQAAAYPAGSMLAQASAATVAASKTAALPVSVRTNRRSGVSRRCAHAVRSENGEAAALGSVTSGIVSRAAPAHDLRAAAQPPCGRPSRTCAKADPDTRLNDETIPAGAAADLGAGCAFSLTVTASRLLR